MTSYLWDRIGSFVMSCIKGRVCVTEWKEWVWKKWYLCDVINKCPLSSRIFKWLIMVKDLLRIFFKEFSKICWGFFKNFSRVETNQLQNFWQSCRPLPHLKHEKSPVNSSSRTMLCFTEMVCKATDADFWKGSLAYSSMVQWKYARPQSWVIYKLIIIIFSFSSVQ